MSSVPEVGVLSRPSYTTGALSQDSDNPTLPRHVRRKNIMIEIDVSNAHHDFW